MKNISRRGVLTLAIELCSFGSPKGLASPHFGECECHPHTLPKVGLQHLPWIHVGFCFDLLNRERNLVF